MISADNNENKQRLALFGAWVSVLSLVVVAYWPGLGGPFLFDDFSSVSRLGDLGGVRNWETFKAFVLGGTSGPTGRPLSLLTYLADARDWPAESWPFKRTNLVIHMMNGLLLGILISQVLGALKVERSTALWVSMVSAACWMLHPFLVSTTLYVVQRMAQLSTMFMFAGLVGYVYGRCRLPGDPVRAYAVMSLSLGAGTVLAILSKENGILLPLLAGVVEFVIFSNGDGRHPRLNRAWMSLFILIPSALIFLYLGLKFAAGDAFEIVPPREFSIFERLLTQPRVLADYLQNWYLPKLYTTGVFQDHFLKSKGLLTPATTILAIIFHAALMTSAIVQRRRWPLWSLAILFFYAGHLLESSVLNLELYFEHRNYLPACFLFLPLVSVLKERADSRVFALIAVFTLALLGGFTRYSATVWANFDSMVVASAQKAPTSTRAQARYAAALFNAGRVDDALDHLDQAIDTLPGDRPVLMISRTIFLCHVERLRQSEFDAVADVLSGQFYDPRMINMYRELTLAIVERHCPDVSADSLGNMYKSMLEVRLNSDPGSLGYSQLKYFVGFVHAYDNEPQKAVVAFEDSLQARAGASTAMQMAALLATNGHHLEALHVSDLALEQLESQGAFALRRTAVSENDIRVFQAAVRADMAARQGDDTSDSVQ